MMIERMLTAGVLFGNSYSLNLKRKKEGLTFLTDYDDH
jgi:hypothetical protein